MSKYNLSVQEWDVLNHIRNNPAASDYFFKNAQEVKWFYPLQDRGHFKPENNPKPRETDKGLFRIPYWNVLDYLIMLSMKHDNEHYAEFSQGLIDIIRSVSEYKDADENHIDNHHTWAAFVKILSNIPANMIATDVFSYIPIWLRSNFDNTLTTSSITRELIPHIAKSAKDGTNPQAIAQLVKILDGLFTYEWRENKAAIIKRPQPFLFAEPYWITEALTKKGYLHKLMQIECKELIMVVAKKLLEIIPKLQEPSRPTVEYEDTTYGIDIGLDDNNQTIVKITNPELNEPIYNHNFGIINSVHPFDEHIQFIKAINDQKDNPSILNIIHQIPEAELMYHYHMLIDDHSNIWFRDLSKIKDMHHREAHHILMIILKEMIIAGAYIKHKDMKEILREFSNTKYRSFVFRRSIVLAIGVNWQELKDIFWEIFGYPESYMLLSFHAYEAELFTLFENIAEKLTETEINKIREIIEKGRFFISDMPEDQKEYQQNAFKLKWYSALKKNDQFLKEYEKYQSLFDEKYEPSFRQPTSFIGHGESPLNVEEIFNKRPGELVENLDEFENSDKWRGPNVNSLAEVISNAAHAKPEYFTKNINLFINTGYLYLYNILSGLRSAWKENKDINWENLLPFLYGYIDRDEFWNDTFKVPGDDYSANHDWVLGIIGWLIQDGTDDDKHAINFKLNDILIKLIKRIWRGLSASASNREYSIEGRPVDFAANSTPGKILEACIYLSLRIARNRPDKDSEAVAKWDPELKEVFRDSVKEAYPEALVFTGWMLPQISYLDKEYADMAQRVILDSEKKAVWEIFFYGYLFGSLGNPSFYSNMIDHYKKAILHPINKWDSEELLIRHIATGYLLKLKGFDLNNGAMKLIIEEWQIERINHLLRFLGNQYHLGLNASDKRDNEVVKRILDIWKQAYNKYRTLDAQKLTDEDKGILSNVSTLIPFISEIDEENYNWLIQVAPYVQKLFNTAQFIEHLDRLKSKGDPKITAHYIANIFIKLIGDQKPEYKQEHIENILNFLFSNECKELANAICEKYFEDGYSARFQFVWDIRTKYNT